MTEEIHSRKLVRTFRVSKALLEMIKAECCRRNMSISAFIRYAVVRAIGSNKTDVM
jgi:hypothetical protein